MNSYITALQSVQEELTDLLETAKSARASEVSEKLIQNARALERAASGSWRGRHANVYYNELKSVPGGESYLYFKRIQPPFPALQVTSSLYGTQYETRASVRSVEKWKHFSSEYIKEHIYGNVDKDSVETLSGIAKACQELFHAKKDRVVSQLRLAGRHYDDAFLIETADTVDWLNIRSQMDIIEEAKSKHENPEIESNNVATNEVRTPPHIEVLANAKWILDSTSKLGRLGITVDNAIEHLAGLQFLAFQKSGGLKPSGDKVFIGYGQSNAWERLRDFLRDELQLTPIFFNRGSAAGKKTLDRLLEMVDDASIAILVMTKDDELRNGTFHPRLNVVHEAGLFHSRLDNERIIILLENGCERFTNIEGITYIAFSRNKISDTFKEIEDTLKREGILKPES